MKTLFNAKTQRGKDAKRNWLAPLRLCAFALILTITLPALAQFGTFYADQPFLAKDNTGPCASESWPIDDFDDYETDFVELDGLDEGCLWDGAYVAHTYENIPAIWLWDPMDAYTDGLILEDTGGGIAWYEFYRLHSYETVQSLRYNDALGDYSDTDSLIDDTLALGLNYWATRVTNQVIPITWNSNYVGKGY